MGDPFADNDVPRGALIGAAALIGITILSAATARLTGASATESPVAAAVVSKQVRFSDRADGAVVVTSPADDSLVTVLPPGTNGFVRGVMRGLARERAFAEAGSGPPFELTRWSDGRLTLKDPTTGRLIELDAFGPTNAGAFAAVLTAANTSGR